MPKAAKKKRKTSRSKAGGATIGYEAQLWEMADALRGSMDAAEYKHVTLGLLFLKYISDAFEERHGRLVAERLQGADPEDPDEYRATHIFRVPPEARWPHLKAQARQATIGQIVDDAMAGIERDNPALKGVLPKDYARPALDKQRLGQLIDLISNIRVGDEESQSRDVLGRVYEYFLSQFASAEGKKGGEFYTPRSVVTLLVEMIEPYKGRVYDPCCGSSASRFILARKADYYRGLRAVTEDGKWEDWILYMLEAVETTARHTEGRIRAIRSLMDETIERVRAARPKLYSRELVETVFRHPYSRIRFLQEAGLGTRQTASKHLQVLSELGVLKEVRVGRESYYLNTRLMRALSG